jgi:hypothetical protein
MALRLALWSGILPFALFSCFGVSQASGFEVAARHAIVLETTSPVLLGNGEIAARVELPERLGLPLRADLVGPIWLPPEESAPSTGGRPVLASFDFQPEPPSGQLADSGRMVFTLDYSDSSLRGSQLVSGLTLSPTENLILLSCDLPDPWGGNWNLHIPEPDVSHQVLPVTSDIHSATMLGMGLVQRLPEGQSYGIACLILGGEVSAASGENGWQCAFRTPGEIRILLSVVSAEEGVPLTWSVQEEIRRNSSRTRTELEEKQRKWWEDFWERSVLDFSASSAPEAFLLEALWVRCLHGMASHTRGSFPPPEDGMWNRSDRALTRHVILWPLYRGWIFSNHGSDLHCLGYPYHFGMEEEGNAGIPLLSKGPFPVDEPSPPMKDEAMSEEESLLYSTLPLLAHFESMASGGTENLELLYPFLKQNAMAAGAILCSTSSYDLSEWSRRHLAVALAVARGAAESIRIDPKSMEFWSRCLASDFSPDADPIMKVVRDWERRTDRYDSDLLEPQAYLESITSEGLIMNASDAPSVLQTGLVLQALLDQIFSDRGGFLRFFPGIPLDGSWSLEAQRLGVPSGFWLSKMTLTNGVVDSFLLRSQKGGTCRFELPGGWAGAQVAVVSDMQQMVPLTEVRPEEGDWEATGKIFSFETLPDTDYLIGPVW